METYILNNTMLQSFFHPLFPVAPEVFRHAEHIQSGGGTKGAGITGVERKEYHLGLLPPSKLKWGVKIRRPPNLPSPNVDPCFGTLRYRFPTGYHLGVLPLPFLDIIGIFFLGTMVQNDQESRCEYGAIRSSIRKFTRTAHSFACSLLLARSAVLTCSLARLFTHSRACG